MARPPMARTGAALYTLRVLRCERSWDARSSREYAAVLDAALRAAGVEVAEQVEDHAPQRHRHDAELLHLVSLGTQGERRAEEALAEPLMAELLPRCSLVVLEVWQEGSKGEHSLRRLAMAALRLGAPACIVARTAPEPEAWGAWLEGFYRGLREGKGPRAAVKAADLMAQVRAGADRPLTLVRPRSWAGLDEPLIRWSWRPAGWPTPAPDAARLLQAVFRSVRRRRCGYIGVEQMIDALQEHADQHFELAGLMAYVEPHRDTLRRSWEELDASGGQGPDWRGTPRLQALGADLLPDFDAAELIAALRGACDALLMGLSEEETEPEDLPTLTPAQALEVVGGPEDGRRLDMAPGEQLGRSSAVEGVSHQLYEESLLVDPRLSRMHLEWLGEGKVRLPRTVTVYSRGERAFVGPGPASLFADDVVQLTRATRLRGLP
ncbi:MAG: hypothetical protein H6740_23345 [Alphaproteobacteria bacterium]|nr:hypothetical protein [Alphaproteobacteria bacterium]